MKITLLLLVFCMLNPIYAMTEDLEAFVGDYQIIESPTNVDCKPDVYVRRSGVDNQGLTVSSWISYKLIKINEGSYNYYDNNGGLERIYKYVYETTYSQETQTLNYTEKESSKFILSPFPIYSKEKTTTISLNVIEDGDVFLETNIKYYGKDFKEFICQYKRIK